MSATPLAVRRIVKTPATGGWLRLGAWGVGILVLGVVLPHAAVADEVAQPPAQTEPEQPPAPAADLDSARAREAEVGQRLDEQLAQIDHLRLDIADAKRTLPETRDGLSRAEADANQKRDELNDLRRRFDDAKAARDRFYGAALAAFQKDPDFLRATDDLDMARAALRGFTDETLDKLAETPEFRETFEMLRAAEAKAEGLKNDPKADPNDLAAANAALTEAHARINRLQDRALDNDPKVIATRQRFDDATARIKQLREGFERRLDSDPEFAAANAQYLSARKALDTASAALQDVEQQRDRLAAAEQEKSGLVDSARQRLQEAESRADALATDLHGARQEIRALEQRLDEMRRELAVDQRERDQAAPWQGPGLEGYPEIPPDVVVEQPAFYAPPIASLFIEPRVVFGGAPCFLDSACGFGYRRPFCFIEDEPCFSFGFSFSSFEFSHDRGRFDRFRERRDWSGHREESFRREFARSGDNFRNARQGSGGSGDRSRRQSHESFAGSGRSPGGHSQTTSRTTRESRSPRQSDAFAGSSRTSRHGAASLSPGAVGESSARVGSRSASGTRSSEAAASSRTLRESSPQRAAGDATRSASASRHSLEPTPSFSRNSSAYHASAAEAAPGSTARSPAGSHADRGPAVQEATARSQGSSRSDRGQSAPELTARSQGSSHAFRAPAVQAAPEPTARSQGNSHAYRGPVAQAAPEPTARSQSSSHAFRAPVAQASPQSAARSQGNSHAYRAPTAQAYPAPTARSQGNSHAYRAPAAQANPGPTVRTQTHSRSFTPSASHSYTRSSHATQSANTHYQRQSSSGGGHSGGSSSHSRRH